jgi:hypothetical protein
MAENHMKQGVRGALVAGFLLSAFVLLAWFNWSKPRILVLHSFDETVRSVVKTDEGIRRILASNRQPVSTRWHYLAMNRLADETARQLAASMARRTVEQFDPDIIIAVDDEAQQYVAREYAGDAKIKLVFTAIDQKPRDYGYVDQANVTGISEVLPLHAISETLLHLRSGQPAKIAVLTSLLPTGLGRMRQLQTFDWAPHQVLAFHAYPDWASWKSAVDLMAQDVDVILVLSYQGLHASANDTRMVSGGEITRWLNEHARPLPVGTSADYVEEGGILAIYPSALEMGELATYYALSWLRMGSKSDSPLIESEHFRLGARESMLRERHLTLPRIYVEAAHLEELYFP